VPYRGKAPLWRGIAVKRRYGAQRPTACRFPNPIPNDSNGVADLARRARLIGLDLIHWDSLGFHRAPMRHR
jgi:hypothetical protein